MRRNTKLILALSKKLMKLIDIKTELFFAERPFLWFHGEKYNTEDIEERKKDNIEVINKTIEALADKLDLVIPKQIIKQEELL